MASYKRQRKHGVRAQTIQGPTWLFDQQGAAPNKPEMNRITIMYQGITNVYPTLSGAYGTWRAIASFPNCFCQAACINPIQQGSLRYQRTGSVVNLLRLHGTFQAAAASTMDDDKIESFGGRILILYDRQTNGGLDNGTNPDGPAFIGDLLAGQRFQGSTGTQWSSEINLNFAERFIVLYDKKFTFPELIKGAQYFGSGMAGITTSVTQPGDGTTSWGFHEIDVDLTGLRTVFNSEALDTNNLCRQIQSGGIYTYFISDAKDIVRGNTYVWQNKGILTLDFEA